MSEGQIPPWEHPDAFGVERTKNWNGRNCVGCGRFRKGIRPSGAMCEPCRNIRYWPTWRPRVIRAKHNQRSTWWAFVGFDENGEWIWAKPDDAKKNKGFV